MPRTLAETIEDDYMSAIRTGNDHAAAGIIASLLKQAFDAGWDKRATYNNFDEGKEFFEVLKEKAWDRYFATPITEKE